MSNVILYESTATDFFNQGLGPLTEAKDPKVTEVGNGEFYLELNYPTTGRLFNQLKNGNLIKSDAGHELKDQRFEIKRVVKSMKQGYVSVYAEHISNQALDIALPANVTLSGSAQNALQQAQSNGLGTFKPFTMSSDITTTNQTKLSIREFKNLKQALGGVEGSILDTWGGEYKFDNYHISLFKKRGRQANAMIAYGRNLVDLEQEENIMNTFTSVYPYAVWRDDEGVEHIIEGSVIHSEHADKYPHHKVLPVDFTLEAEDDTKPTATKLNQLATAYIENNDIGIPEVSIKLTHLDLSKTLDYKEYAEVEKLNVFDEVKIYFADFDINTTAKIVRIVWNVNLERHNEIEVGKVRASLSDRINTIGKQISEAIKEAQDARNVSMVAANGVNMNFFGPDEPTAIKVGDRWFMQDGQYTISKVWDGVIWRVVNDPRLAAQNKQAIEDQQKIIDEATETAGQALTAGNQAKELANQAKTAAENASEVGGQALTAGQQAQELANEAKAESSSALLKANEAIGSANILTTRVNTLNSQYDGLQTVVEGKASKTQVTQLSTQINLRVEKDKIINQINVSTEGILIAGSKTHITGQTTIDTGVIETAHIANAAISNAKIADLAVNEAKIDSLAVTNAKIGSAAISEAKIADLAVTTAKIANAAISSAKIGEAAIKTAHIGDAQITTAKISSLSASKVTTGTLNAAQVAVINMDASNIVTGYLSGNRIRAGRIDGNNGYWDLETGNFVTQSGGSTISITDGAIKASYGSTKIDFFGSQIAMTGVVDGVAKRLEMNPGAIRFDHGGNASYINYDGANIFMDNLMVPQGGRYSIAGVGTILNSDSGNFTIMGSELARGTVTIGIGVTSSFVNVAVFRRSEIDWYTNLNLNGHRLLTDSDERIKKDIVDAKVVELDLYRKLRFVNFRYKNANKSTDLQFGLIAQEAGHLASYDVEKDLWQISTTGLVMHNSKAIHELVKEHDKAYMMVNGKADMSINIAHRTLSEVEQLKVKVKELESKLESA